MADGLQRLLDEWEARSQKASAGYRDLTNDGKPEEAHFDLGLGYAYRKAIRELRIAAGLVTDEERAAREWTDALWAEVTGEPSPRDPVEELAMSVAEQAEIAMRAHIRPDGLWHYNGGSTRPGEVFPCGAVMGCTLSTDRLEGVTCHRCREVLEQRGQSLLATAGAGP